jgi:hypothetical protein
MNMVNNQAAAVVGDLPCREDGSVGGQSVRVLFYLALVGCQSLQQRLF